MESNVAVTQTGKLRLYLAVLPHYHSRGEKREDQKIAIIAAFLAMQE